MITLELIGIIVGVLAILIAIFGMGIAVIHKIDSGDAKNEAKIDSVRTELKAETTEVKTELKAEIAEVDAKIDVVRTEFDAKIDVVRTELKAEIAEGSARAEAQGALIIAELRSFRESVEGRLNNVEREQARQEGVLSVLVQRDRVAARREDESADEESSAD